jgi:hypothetical protein
MLTEAGIDDNQPFVKEDWFNTVCASVMLNLGNLGKLIVF